jgi:hypothetical protein
MAPLAEQPTNSWPDGTITFDVRMSGQGTAFLGEVATGSLVK